MKLNTAWCIAASIVLALPLRSAEEEKAAPPTDFVEITPKLEESLDKGLAWLAKNQSRDGSWSAQGGDAGYQYQMAMTGLAGLSFLAAGHSPGRGKYSANVSRAIEFVLKNQDRDGLITSRNDGYQMYGHGFAMTFLAEAYGMDCGTDYHERIRQALITAVKKTGQAQSFRGGWYYSPNSGSDEGSVTVTQVQALRSVRNAGIEVPEKVISQAIEYIKQCQNQDGGIRYSVQSGQQSTPALTAAGVEVFLMAGRYRTNELARACEYLKKNLDPRRSAGHDFYTHFYGVQAMFHVGGDYWSRYFGSLRDRLITTQRSDGSWQGDHIGSTYGTALATLMLAVPYRYLPIYQK